MSTFKLSFPIKMSNEVLNLTVIEWVTRNVKELRSA